jgi:hypothetical protein
LIDDRGWRRHRIKLEARAVPKRAVELTANRRQPIRVSIAIEQTSANLSAAAP